MFTLFLFRLVGLASDEFGAALLSLNDLDGDGIDDLVVGAPGADADAGAVYLYRGAATGYLDTASPTVLVGAAAGDRFGDGLALGDVDGDGVDELAVYGSGCECVTILAGADGFATRTTITGTAGSGFGSAMDLGDLEGDGFADLLVGAPGDDVAGTDAGAAFVYSGSAGGVSTTPDVTLLGGAAGDEFGTSVIAAGDMDLDGDDELAVGAPGVDPYDAGDVYIWLGAPAGIAATADWSSGAGVHSRQGLELMRGDFDGDGYPDVAYVSLDSTALLVSGSASGPGGVSGLLATLGYLDSESVRVGTGADGDGDGVDSPLLQYHLSPYFPTGCDVDTTMESWFEADLDLPNAKSLAAAGDVEPGAVDEVWVGAGGTVYLAAAAPDDDDDGHPLGWGGPLEDCDDTDRYRRPLTWETDGDGVDSNCDGLDDAPVSTSPPACRSVATIEAARALLDADQRVATDVPGWVAEAEDALAASGSQFWVTVDDGAQVWHSGWLGADSEPSGITFDFDWYADWAYRDSHGSCLSGTSWVGSLRFSLTWPEGTATGLRSMSALRSGGGESGTFIGTAEWTDGTERAFATVVESGRVTTDSFWDEQDDYHVESLVEESDGCSFDYVHHDGVESDGRMLDGAYWKFRDGVHSVDVVEGYSNFSCYVAGRTVGRQDGGPWYPLDPDTWAPLGGLDADGDGWPEDDDCNDADPTVNPCADETPGCIDQDCDRRLEDSDGDGYTDCGDCGVLDPALPVEWFGEDDDGDGFGDTSVGYGCEPPAEGGSTVPDCDDSSALVSPEALEECNAIDDDCDGDVDESSASPRYEDADADGYGGRTIYGAECPDSVATSGDCNDQDADIAPDVPEIADDGVDQDCDGKDEVSEPEPDEVEPGCLDGWGVLFGVVGLAGARRRGRPARR